MLEMLSEGALPFHVIYTKQEFPESQWIESAAELNWTESVMTASEKTQRTRPFSAQSSLAIAGADLSSSLGLKKIGSKKILSAREALYLHS
jgi:hypothetical protein